MCYVKVCKVHSQIYIFYEKVHFASDMFWAVCLSDKDLRIYKIGSVGIGIFSRDFSDLGKI